MYPDLLVCYYYSLVFDQVAWKRPCCDVLSVWNMLMVVVCL